MKVEYREQDKYFDSSGVFLFEMKLEEDVIYSPVVDQLIDFQEPGYVSVRDRDSDAELSRYPFAPNETTFSSAFPVADGKLCVASFYPAGKFCFDPLTGEVQWSDESLGWDYAAVGKGAVVVRFTHLVYLFEGVENYYGPVREELRDSLTGEPILPEGARSGFLVPEVSTEGQAVFVNDDSNAAVWLVDTATANYSQLSLAGRNVLRRLACQSFSGNAIAALGYRESGGTRSDFQIVVWKAGEEEGESVDWNEQWGDPEGVASLSVSDDGASIVFGMANGSVYLLETETGSSDMLVEGYDIGPVPVIPGYGTAPTYGVEVPRQRVLPDGERVLLGGADGGLRVLDMDTREDLYQLGRSVEFEFLSNETVLFVAPDWTLQVLDLSRLEISWFGTESTPRISGTWPVDDEGLSTVFFGDGSWQAFHAGTGEFVGERTSVLPVGTHVLAGDSKRGIVWASDSRVYNLDTGEVIFDLDDFLEGGSFYRGTKEMVRRLLADPYLQVQWLNSGTQIALFVSATDTRFGYNPAEDRSFGSGKVVILDLDKRRLVAEREYNWSDLVESDDFIVSMERIQDGDVGADYRVGVYDSDRNLAELYRIAVPLGSSVRIAPDGRHFAVLSSGSERLEEESQYEVEVRLREFALEKNGFREIEPTVWKDRFRSGEFELGTPQLLDYQGPGAPVLALALRDQLLELRDGKLMQWEEEPNNTWLGTTFIDQTANGDLLLIDPFGRLGVYATFVPKPAEVEVMVDEDGFAVPDLPGSDLDRFDVWFSSNLKEWRLWDWSPIKVTTEQPVFYRSFEWVKED
ncbi:hypothetical protein QEH56_11380 [Pelagicoccus enzymogenes]|nr:hypothetical protein [Pelagicoccus enzymogenes]